MDSTRWRYIQKTGLGRLKYGLKMYKLGLDTNIFYFRLSYKRLNEYMF